MGTHQLRLTLSGHDPWSTIPERHKPLPDPVNLQKSLVDSPVAAVEKAAARKPAPKRASAKKPAAPEEESKVKKFFKDLFQK